MSSSRKSGAPYRGVMHMKTQEVIFNNYFNTTHAPPAGKMFTATALTCHKRRKCSLFFPRILYSVLVNWWSFVFISLNVVITSCHSLLECRHGTKWPQHILYWRSPPLRFCFSLLPHILSNISDFELIISCTLPNPIYQRRIRLNETSS